jgi:hypothetical protein
LARRTASVSSGRSGCLAVQDRRLMFDLAAIAIAIACFAFIFLLLYVLEKV